jgi:phosphoglycerol transferase MdoB-like AlkP superfamily enzyme
MSFYLFFGFIAVMTSIIDLGTYEYWGSKPNLRGFLYLTNPTEAFASIENTPYSAYFIIFLIEFRFFYFLLRKAVNTYVFLPLFERKKRVFIFFVAFIFLGVGIRGGIQQIPINQSAAYFSEYRIINHVSLNSVWNFLYTFKRTTKPQKLANFEEAKQTVDSLHVFSKENIFELQKKNQKPNVMILLLETWTSDVVQLNEKGIDVTPEFSKLLRNGFFFDNIYSQGHRTDQGIVSILSATPSLFDHLVIKDDAVIRKLPSLPQVFKENGYENYFYYGGELGFGNMKSYLLEMGVKNFVSKYDFPSNQLNSKWGAHDEHLFEKFLNDDIKEPFFTTLLTLTSHEPFEAPMKTIIKGEEKREKFLNSVFYTDREIGKFFEKAKEKPWFKNTLFLLIADHGTWLASNYKHYDHRKYKIPFLIYSELLPKEVRGKKTEAVGAQVDLANTILSLLKMKPTQTFKFSNNLLAKKRNHFAYFPFPGGIGFVTDSNAISFSLRTKKVLKKSSEKNINKNIKILKKYYQYLQDKTLGKTQ